MDLGNVGIDSAESFGTMNWHQESHLVEVDTLLM